MRLLAARIVLAISRYRIVGTPPKHPVCVLVAAPHTSNWDFFLMLAMAWSSGLTPVWLGKKELFFFPVKWLLVLVGGIPVDRENATGLVDQIAACE
jgi:1-acyl-sn-glycerol-3-phosphate acyltransferase